jgi:hypothetical protein
MRLTITPISGRGPFERGSSVTSMVLARLFACSFEQLIEKRSGLFL